MKLSVFNPVLGDMPFESAMQYLAQCSVDAVEIGCGGYPGKAHCNPALLLEDENALSDFKRILKKNGLELAALSAERDAMERALADLERLRGELMGDRASQEALLEEYRRAGLPLKTAGKRSTRRKSRKKSRCTA